jgi:hypothetical protein
MYSEGWDIDYVMNQANIGLGVSIGGLSYNDNVVIAADALRTSRRMLRRSRPFHPTISTSTIEVTTSTRTRGILVTPRRILGQETRAPDRLRPRDPTKVPSSCP